MTHKFDYTFILIITIQTQLICAKLYTIYLRKNLGSFAMFKINKDLINYII